MNLEKYAIVTDSDHLVYEFLSEGIKGRIKKIISYQKISTDFFNLAFGDWDEIKNKINDKARTNNGDTDKILATVASSVIDFIQYNPRAIIRIKGSSKSRTRLYQIEIIRNLPEIYKEFEIEGLFNNAWEPFVKGKNYEEFLLKPKQKL